MRNIVIAVLLAVWAAGCQGNAPSGNAAAKANGRVVAKVSVRLPAATAETVDALLTPGFSDKISAIGHVQNITCISHDGLFEGYVDIDANSADQAGILRQVEEAIAGVNLPADAEAPVVTMVDRVPTVTATEVPEIAVDLNRERLAMYGLTAEQVQGVVSKALADQAGGTGSADDLGQTAIATSDGRSILLRDVATLRRTIRPNCIARKYPLQGPATAPAQRPAADGS